MVGGKGSTKPRRCSFNSCFLTIHFICLSRAQIVLGATPVQG